MRNRLVRSRGGSGGEARWERTIAAGVECYDRTMHLARILPVGPDEIADDSPAGRRRILVRLARALRAERNRGRAGHWTYDLNRHIALSQAYAAERRAVPKTKPPAGSPAGGQQSTMT